MRELEDKDEEKSLESKQTNPIVNAQLEQFKQMNELAAEVKESANEDRESADDLYAFMQDQIDIEGDKNPATREAMAKALELKLKATDQKIELLKIKAKLINPNKGTSVNINLGEYDQKKGCDTNQMISIVEELRDENSD